MRALLTAAFLSLAAFPAAAAVTTTLTSVDNGWYRSDGYHFASNRNIFTGILSSRRYNNFQAFDISGLVDPVRSAVLTFFAGNGLFRGDATETINVFDVTSSAANVLSSSAAGSALGQSIYSDLQSGLFFGAATVTRPSGRPDMPEITVALNSAGVAALNAAISANAQTFLLGTTLVSQDGNDRLWSFSNNNGSSSSLTVSVVPLPAAGLILLTALAGAGAAFRRRMAL